jgi:hypothetical protein
MGKRMDYENYIKKLKEARAPFDDAGMRARIETRVNRRTQPARLLLAGALAVFLISFMGYLYGRYYAPGGNETLAEYIIQQKDASSDSLMSYVLADQ